MDAVDVFWLIGAVLLLGGLSRLARRRKRSGPEAVPVALPAELAQKAASVQPAPGFSIIPTRWDLPPELVGFQRTEAFELDPQALTELLSRMKRIPRPQQSLHRLMAPGFMEQADTDTLATLVLEEPRLAARVLAEVNSPFYGLRRPVASVEKAIGYLGADSVRSICLQCLMGDVLRPDDPALIPIFDRWWHASAIASHLCLKIGQRIGLPDTGSTTTLVVLSFLGHMVSLTLLPPEETRRNAALGFLERTRREQDSLGLCAGELGCLLMSEWQMPPQIVEEVRCIDRILTTPPKQLDEVRGLGSALAYYCARVGEKLASGEWAGLESAAPEHLKGAEFFHLQTHFLIRPQLGRLSQDLQVPDFAEGLTQMLQSLRGSA
jgi:HD-like signal output (HDOD) protein